jgi:glycine/D-amino acid oxidase-like deaminating enzyme
MKNITIIGAGIVCIATACYLRRDGHAVTVVFVRAQVFY